MRYRNRAERLSEQKMQFYPEPLIRESSRMGIAILAALSVFYLAKPYLSESNPQPAPKLPKIEITAPEAKDTVLPDLPIAKAVTANAVTLSKVDTLSFYFPSDTGLYVDSSTGLNIALLRMRRDVRASPEMQRKLRDFQRFRGNTGDGKLSAQDSMALWSGGKKGVPSPAPQGRSNLPPRRLPNI